MQNLFFFGFIKSRLFEKFFEIVITYKINMFYEIIKSQQTYFTVMHSATSKKKNWDWFFGNEEVSFQA